jgi:hypothetical protein
MRLAPLKAAARRARRVAGHGPVVIARVMLHRAAAVVSRARFRAALQSERTSHRFLASGPRLGFDFGVPVTRLVPALARLEELVYAGAVPVSSDVWLDLRTGAVFSPLPSPAGRPVARPRPSLQVAPMCGLEEAIAVPPFRNDRKIPQDVARLTTLWLLAAADAHLAGDEPPRARQARFLAHVEAFFAGAASPRHAFWACPMDTGIGATNLLLTAEYFVRLDATSPEAAALRSLRDCWCSRALRYIRWFDERTPTLNNNHHLLNRISSALLAGASDDARLGEASLRELHDELGHHFDEDGLLAEGSTWYHAFVHDALRLAVDILSAVRRGDPAVEALRRRVEALRDVGELLSAAGELLLVGDADGATGGPDVAIALADRPDGSRRFSLVRRPATLLRAGDGPGHAGVISCGVREVDARRAAGDEGAPIALLRRGALTWTTTRLRGAADAGVTVRHLPGFGAVLVSHGRNRVVFRTAPARPPPALGHFHLDLGSTYVAASDGWLNVDPGVLTYTGDPACRVRLRAAAAHPTLVPDERQLVIPTGLFSAAARDVRERIIRDVRGVRIEHAADGDSYFLSARVTRGGLLIVRQWTRSPRHNLPRLTRAATSYGYLV